MKADPVDSLAELGATILHAAVAWLLVAPFVTALVYLGTRPLIRAAAARLAGARVKDVDVA
jgi:hypothetical protein